MLMLSLAQNEHKLAHLVGQVELAQSINILRRDGWLDRMEHVGP